MKKKDWIEDLLFAGFRFLAVILIVTGALSLIFQLLNSWPAFDPSYLSHFLASVVLRPVIVMLTGLLLIAVSGRLAKYLSGKRNDT